MIRVLIVDDEEDICDFLKQMLENMGLEVENAMLGEDALQMVYEQNWNLAIVDLKLTSSVTGLHVIKALRDKDPETIVVAMSGYIDVGLRQEAEKLRVSDFLEKPGDLSLDVFSEKVKAMISKIGKEKP